MIYIYIYIYIYISFHPQGILDVYHYALSQVDLYGPTNFSSVLDATIGYASGGVSQANQQYHILLIITVSEGAGH